jgi:TonB-linked SusC/RagA family outer membrane protein
MMRAKMVDDYGGQNDAAASSTRQTASTLTSSRSLPFPSAAPRGAARTHHTTEVAMQRFRSCPRKTSRCRRGAGLVRMALTAALLAAFAASASAQESSGRVTGIVRDAETGQPVPGARVAIEGTRHTSITAENGRFLIIDVRPGIYRLVVSSIGYAEASRENVRVEAGGTATVDVGMKAQALMIEEIVVTGVVDPISGLKVPFTVGKVSTEDLPIPPNTSAAGAIQGKVAGAQIIRASSPGSGAYIQLRTPTSIYGSNGPLYVVDGVILSTAFDRTTVDIESLDIESIEVIKGAAATSLYGSRAANGVIAITTKRGSDAELGRTRITARSEFGFNTISKMVPLATGAHYFLTNEEGYFIDADGNVLENPLEGRVVNPRRMMDVPWGPNKTYDNVDRFFKAGQYWGNTITLAQNSASTNFNLSFNNYKTTGILEGNDGFSRNSFRMNVDHRPRDDLSIRFTGYHMRSFRDRVAGEPFEDLLRFLPDVDLGARGLNGEPYRIQPGLPFTSTVNPLYYEWANDNWEKRARTQGSITARFNPRPWLVLDANLGYDRSDRLMQDYIAKGTKLSEDDELGEEGRYRLFSGITDSYTGSFTATLTHAFGPLTTRTYYRAVLEREENNTKEMIGENLAVRNVKDMSVALERTTNSTITESRATGHMVATALDYADKYIADVLIRRDGSSRFGPDARWATYYRAAANWRISQEPWFNVPHLSEFQIRFSRGTAGGRPNFSWQYETFNVSNAGLVSKGTLGNRFLRPEHTTENELGLRAVIDDRVSIDLSYVRTRTRDQIVPVALPGPYGFNTQWRNAGTIAGRTYEATIEAQLIRRRNFSWRANLVVDRNRHRVERFDRPCYRENMVFYCEGMVMGEFWTTRLHRKPEELAYRHDPETLKQFQTNDDGLLVWVGEGNTWKDGLAKGLWGTSTTIDGFTYQWGMPFMETDELGNARYFKTGDGNADFNFGFGNTIRWGRFTIYGLVNGQIGADIYNSTKGRMYNRWRHGDVVQLGKPDERKKPIDYYRALYNNGLFTDYFIEDGSYAKLTELSVRYSLRGDQLGALQRLGIRDMTLGIAGRNLFTITGYSGFDPEVGSTFNRRDLNPYPQYRTFTGEIRVGF